MLTGHSYRNWRFVDCFVSVSFSKMQHISLCYFFTPLITGWLLRKLQTASTQLQGEAGKWGGGIIGTHWKMLQSFYNYGSSGVINHWPRQFSDTGSANYMLGDRIALLQLHPINIFCRDVRVRRDLRSASCYHINMKPPSLGMTPGSRVQYRLQHWTAAERLRPKMWNGSISIAGKQVWHQEVPVKALLEDYRTISYVCGCEVRYYWACDMSVPSCELIYTQSCMHSTDVSRLFTENARAEDRPYVMWCYIEQEKCSDNRPAWFSRNPITS